MAFENVGQLKHYQGLLIQFQVRCSEFKLQYRSLPGPVELLDWLKRSSAKKMCFRLDAQMNGWVVLSCRCWMWSLLRTHQTLFNSSCPSWRMTASQERSGQRENMIPSLSSSVRVRLWFLMGMIRGVSMFLCLAHVNFPRWPECIINLSLYCAETAVATWSTGAYALDMFLTRSDALYGAHTQWMVAFTVCMSMIHSSGVSVQHANISTCYLCWLACVVVLATADAKTSLSPSPLPVSTCFFQSRVLHALVALL